MVQVASVNMMFSGQDGSGPRPGGIRGSSDGRQSGDRPKGYLLVGTRSTLNHALQVMVAPVSRRRPRTLTTIFPAT